MSNEPFFFGIRHLSPAGAFYLRQFLEEKRPKMVLVEGPCDLEDTLVHIQNSVTKPPIAVLAYTKEAPVRTILYPFAEYSPEYQAVLWCGENGAVCRFMDLPTDVFLALPSVEEAAQGEEDRFHVYRALDRQTGEDGHETFWERTLEQAGSAEGYHQGSNLFGKSLRELTQEKDSDWAEITLREAWMREKIREAVSAGTEPEEIVVVTGSYHVEGLKSWNQAPSPEEKKRLDNMPRVEASHTLMPYSDYRLSSRSGYGAGNKAPAYYALLWESLQAESPMRTAYGYLSKIAGYQRNSGTPVSSAEVIEAVRLSHELARLRGGQIPALRDLRDAAVTCLGRGNMASISLAVADTEIGTNIGSLPDGVSRTSIQEDFYRQLKELRLEKYRDITAQDLALDLREKRNVASEKSAFLDLHRSFFLHRLRVLGVSFAAEKKKQQDNATWGEQWVLRWTPEAEIELVEAALKGDTVVQAAAFQMKEQADSAGGIGAMAQMIEDSFLCGMPAAAAYATDMLARRAVDAVSLEELAKTAERLSAVIRFGGIRQVDDAPLLPILEKIFYRACLLLPNACVCDDSAANTVITAMQQLNMAALSHEFLKQDAWLDTLWKVADRDDLNTRLSGFAAAILLERGQMNTERLKLEVMRRLSFGTPADLGAGWFEGLAMKNRYALIARLSLWESLDAYLESLDDEEFKRALVFLRRAFADFGAREKDEIAENLGEIWNLNGSQVSEAVNAALGQEEMKIVESLDDFDFDL
ncbi:MAG: hypothetical protein K2I22_13790 [Lachnospiraceae bacterium]|nr:hypothetical protein [Lachnospiraceae bacterium]